MYIEFKDNLFDDYLRLDQEQKDFLQRLVFFEYVELIDKENFKGSPLTLQNILYMDMQDYLEVENYEGAQAIKDVLKLYTEEFD